MLGARYDIRHQSFLARPVLADDHRDLADGRMRGEYGFDLAWFHPVATDLHLLVRTPREQQLP
ncbi:hypothetical protein, partial [Streptomyces sp. NPDC001985]|uniref:hypothetical protein n=1 Tax=Streptomyces sp. NPDC001985 TaxID=3154406 RepID=UPI00331DCABE